MSPLSINRRTRLPIEKIIGGQASTPAHIPQQAYPLHCRPPTEPENRPPTRNGGQLDKPIPQFGPIGQNSLRPKSNSWPKNHPHPHQNIPTQNPENILLRLIGIWCIFAPVKTNSSQKSSQPKLSRLKDDAWIQSHFEWLIDHYPGQYVVVAEGEPFIGSNVAELERRAQERHPRAITSGMPIPKPEDFSCLFWFDALRPSTGSGLGLSEVEGLRLLTIGSKRRTTLSESRRRRDESKGSDILVGIQP